MDRRYVASRAATLLVRRAAVLVHDADRAVRRPPVPAAPAAGAAGPGGGDPGGGGGELGGGGRRRGQSSTPPVQGKKGSDLSPSSASSLSDGSSL